MVGVSVCHHVGVGLGAGRLPGWSCVVSSKGEVQASERLCSGAGGGIHFLQPQEKQGFFPSCLRRGIGGVPAIVSATVIPLCKLGTPTGPTGHCIGFRCDGHPPSSEEGEFGKCYASFPRQINYRKPSKDPIYR